MLPRLIPKRYIGDSPTLTEPCPLSQGYVIHSPKLLI